MGGANDKGERREEKERRAGREEEENRGGEEEWDGGQGRGRAGKAFG